jgi:hypothetical protein
MAIATVTILITPIAAIKTIRTATISEPDDRRWSTSPTPTFESPDARI